MNTLGEDIMALQKRLLEETGLEWDLELYAHEIDRATPAEKAIGVGEIMVVAIGSPAKVSEAENMAWLKIGTCGVTATIICKELLGKGNA